MPTSYPDDADHYLGPNDYANYINGLTNQKPMGPDEAYTPSAMRAGKMVAADSDMHDAIQEDPNVDAQTPLEQLIPKIVSKTATKEEYMRFYKLTGQAL